MGCELINEKFDSYYKSSSTNVFILVLDFCGGSAELRASSGVLSSPNFPNNYGQRETCFWTIIAPQGYRVQFVIHWFGIEDHRYSRPGICADDTFVVSESLGESTRLVAKLCGCREPLLTHISSKEKMWIKFTSYMKNNWPGFYATYQVLCKSRNTFV